MCSDKQIAKRQRSIKTKNTTYSRRNALKHGLFAQELYISDQDRPVYDAMRKELDGQLHPESPLQRIAFDNIVCFTWQCKLAQRLDTVELVMQLGAIDNTEEEASKKGPNPLNKWYGMTDAGVRRGIEVLASLRDDIQNRGLLNFEHRWKGPIIEGFDAQFYDSLVQFGNINKDAMLLAEHLIAHRDTFGGKLPPLDSQGGETHTKSQPEWSTMPQHLRLQMVITIVELKAQQLKDLLAIRGVSEVIMATTKSPPTYFATVSRALQRAIRWFQELREQGL